MSDRADLAETLLYLANRADHRMTLNAEDAPILRQAANLLDPAPTDDAAETVRVRIAVAVDEHGEWSVVLPGETVNEAVESLTGRWTYSWVEADVPLPLAPQTVLGTVTAGEQ